MVANGAGMNVEDGGVDNKGSAVMRGGGVCASSGGAS